jgi:tetratricopeptide (TPR) repeat protein
VDLEKHEVRRGGEVFRLSPTEAKLLRYLSDRPGELCRSEQLLVDVFGYKPGLRTRTLTTTVRRLRTKIEADPGEPLHLLTVWGAGFTFEPPPTAPKVEMVVATAGGFVGREAALARLADACERGGLIAVRGLGGIGKTRLSREWLARAPVRGWFVDLAATSTRADVIHALAAAIGGTPRTELDAVLEEVGRALALHGRGVVVLDNAEQVPDAVAEVGAQLTAAAPGVSLVVTTRVPIAGVPEEIGLEPLSQAEAMAVLTAGAARVGVVLATDEARALADEVVRLPLALELASARLRVLTAPELVKRLARSSDVLAKRDGTVRHRSLAAVFDWSWDLLEPAERQALARLSVFEGGFDAAAAEARYTMFEFVRQAARGRLEHVDEAVLAHLTHFAAWTIVQTDAITGLEGAAASRALHRELPNLRAALRRGITVAANLAVDVLIGIGQLAFERPSVLDGELLDGLERAELDDAHRAVVCNTRAAWLRARGRYDEALLSIGRAEALDVDNETRAMTALVAAATRSARGELDQALVALDEVDRLVPHQEPPLYRMSATMERATVAVRQRRFDDAEKSLLQVIRWSADCPYPRGIARGFLCRVYRAQGRLAEAESCVTAALEVFGEQGAAWSASIARHNLGSIQLHGGQFEAARDTLRTAVEEARDLGNGRTFGAASTALGQCLVRLGEAGEAVDVLADGLLAYQLIDDALGQVQARSTLALALIHVDRADDAHGALAGAREIVQARAVPGAHLLSIAEAAVALARKDAAAALEALEAHDGPLEAVYRALATAALAPDRGKVARARAEATERAKQVVADSSMIALLLRDHAVALSLGR